MNIHNIFTNVMLKTSGIGVGVLILMMLLTTADVIGRFALNRPIQGAYELTEFMMVVVVILCLAYTEAIKENAVIDFLANRLSSKIRAFADSVGIVLSVAVFGLVTWQSIVQANLLNLKGQTSGVLLIPVYPFLWVIAFGTGLLCIALLCNLYQSLGKLVARNEFKLYLKWVIGIALVVVLFSFPFWQPVLQVPIQPALAGLVGLAILVALMLVGMPIGFAMAVMGFLGVVFINGFEVSLVPLRSAPFTNVSSYTMSVIPLFILMGMFAFYSGLAEDLFVAAYTWVGRLWGGMAMATVVACCALAAVSGSALATAATMATVALPAMKKYKYSDMLATGVCAAGGTIGSLIPPSLILIVYAMLTDESVGVLFIAGVLPGITEGLFYMITIYLICKRNPLMGPRGPQMPIRAKVVALKNGWQVIVLFLVVMGGIYLGVFTPTEAGAIGAFGAFLFALTKGQITYQKLRKALLESGKMTAMIFLILVGASFFGYFLALTRLPYELAGWVNAMDMNRYLTITLIIAIYIFLGTFMSSIGMIVLTVPIFFPLIVALGFDPIWFGIIIVRVTEVAQISPPYGINCFIVQKVAKDVSIGTVYKGALIFLVADLIHIAFLVAFPQVALWLPNLMGR